MKLCIYAFLIINFFIVIHADKILSPYAQEFTALEEHPDYHTIFDKSRHVMLRYIDAELKNYPQLTAGSKFLYRGLLAYGTVIADKKHMPHLYNYISEICTKAAVPMPIILVTIFPGFNNAAATQLFLSSGVVIIGRDMLIETDEEEIEAVLAHEIGHIKYNHANQTMALTTIISLLTGIWMYQHSKEVKDIFHIQALAGISGFIAGYVSRFIINKSFEREADRFAYGEMNKGNGLIKYFTRLQKAYDDTNQDFKETRARMRSQRNMITSDDYIHLDRIYLSAWLNFQWFKAWHWLYHHTPLGAHPSHTVRIKAVKDYLNEQSDQ